MVVPIENIPNPLSSLTLSGSFSPREMAALMLSLLATQSSISLMIVFPVGDKWFDDEFGSLLLGC